jgi:hypothetical protein
MNLSFDRASETLTVINADGTEARFPAANNVASNSAGQWPDGIYGFVQHMTHLDDGPDSAYGSHGGLLFYVSGRTGMEVHSGRATVQDGLGRVGYQHCTEGCIRTTDDAMAYILAAMAGDALQEIVVG